MIEVRGTLISGGVYLPGELVRIEVCFTNLSETKEEHIAVACAELHCQCSYSEQRVRVSSTPKARLSVDGHTSFAPSLGEKGFCILSTQPAILLSNLTLSPGAPWTVYFCEYMPAGGPPSFHGSAVKYAYKLVVGVQRPNGRTHLLRVPLRVLDISNFTGSSRPTSTSAEPVNPFLMSTAREDPALVCAVDNLMAFTSRQRLSSTVITRNKSTVAMFTLFKSAYRIGEDIVGIMDFSSATLPCYSMTVYLRSKEKVNDDHRPPRSQSSYTDTHTSQSMVTLHCQTAHVCLAIPSQCTPAFSTPLMDLSWYLEFELQLAASVALGMSPINNTVEGSCVDDINMGSLPENRDEVWRSPERIKTETMLLSLPVNIVLAPPPQTSSSSAPTEYTMKF